MPKNIYQLGKLALPELNDLLRRIQETVLALQGQDGATVQLFGPLEVAGPVTSEAVTGSWWASADQSSAGTLIFDVTELGSIESNSGGSFVLPYAGTYFISASLRLELDGSGDGEVVIWHGSVAKATLRAAGAAGDILPLSGSCLVEAAAGDRIYLTLVSGTLKGSTTDILSSVNIFRLS